MNSKVPEARSGELTSIINRDIFDEMPGDVPGDQRERWASFRRSYHAAHDLMEPEGFPVQIDFELNSTCQMRCAFCVHGQKRVAKKEMSFETFCRAIDEGERNGLCSIKLNYINEPLLRPDLTRFIRYAKEHGVMNVYMASNGLLLTRQIARELIDAGLSKLMISLDAVTPETYELMRRNKHLKTIEENIRALINMRHVMGVSWPIVRVNFLRTEQNSHEADAFIEKWTGIADSIGFQMQVQVPGVNSGVMPRDEEKTFRCSFPSKQLVVDVDGNILPCCTFNGREMPIGNVQDMTLKEAWHSEKIRALRELHRVGGWRLNPVCAHCMGGEL